MLVRVVRAFPYAADHIHIVHLPADTDAEIADDCVPGLVAAGYVALIEAPAAPAKPVPPAATAQPPERPASRNTRQSKE